MLVSYFFEENFTPERNLNFQRLYLVLSLTVIITNEGRPDVPTETLGFQQDGVHPYFGINVGCTTWYHLLFTKIPTIDTIGLLFWGYMKDKGYHKKVG